MNTTRDSDEGLVVASDKAVEPSLTPSSSSEYTTSDADDSIMSTASQYKSALENYLTLDNNTTEKDLQEKIHKCKEMILESAECSKERQWLVRNLIELRLLAAKLGESTKEKCIFFLGHHFKKKKHPLTKLSSTYCDCCKCAIWTMLQSWLVCNDCGFVSHWKCIPDICRICVNVTASERRGYTNTKNICPERGLSAQGFRCAECLTKIISKMGYAEPRLCDYNGLYYCQRCHWNYEAVIPARVIRNWDMTPRKVCQASYQLLTMLYDRPVLNVEELNPKLFTLVPDLALIKRLREDLQMMKKYLVVCPEANSKKLPWKTSLRRHFLSQLSTYSIKDLVDLQNGELVDEINRVYDTMRNHITETCELCKARGYLCELCGNNQVIYPWNPEVINCRHCSAVYHRICWVKRNHSCPKCLRLQEYRAIQCQKLIDMRNSKTGSADGQVSYDDLDIDTNLP